MQPWMSDSVVPASPLPITMEVLGTGATRISFRNPNSRSQMMLMADWIDVKMAVTEAAQGRTGPTIARLLKFCFNYDPAGRRYSLAITRVAAAFTIMLAVGFGVVVGVTRKRRRAKSDPKEPS